MGSFVLNPGNAKSLIGGDLRVRDDVESTSAAIVTMRSGGMVYLRPGQGFNDWA